MASLKRQPPCEQRRRHTMIELLYPQASPPFRQRPESERRWFTHQAGSEASVLERMRAQAVAEESTSSSW